MATTTGDRTHDLGVSSRARSTTELWSPSQIYKARVVSDTHVVWGNAPRIVSLTQLGQIGRCVALGPVRVASSATCVFAALGNLVHPCVLVRSQKAGAPQNALQESLVADWGQRTVLPLPPPPPLPPLSRVVLKQIFRVICGNGAAMFGPQS